jgi:hypothetical protein
MPLAIDPTTAVAPPVLAFVFELRIQVGVPLEVGQVHEGRRRIIPITGGTFEGPGLKGTILPGGADWQMLRGDGVAEIDARYTLQTDTGQLIYIQNAGIRHAPPDVMRRLIAGEAVNPALVYFRTAPTFETAAPELQDLTRAIYVASGERHPTEVVIRVWRVS